MADDLDVGAQRVRCPDSSIANPRIVRSTARLGRIAGHYLVVVLGTLLWLAGVVCSIKLLIIALTDLAPGAVVRFVVVAVAAAIWTHCLRGRLGGVP